MITNFENAASHRYSGVRDGVAGGASTPQKFWFVENLGKIPGNPGKNGAQRCLIWKNGAQLLQKYTN